MPPLNMLMRGMMVLGLLILSVMFLARVEIFKISQLKAPTGGSDFEVRLCEDFIFESGGIMAKWESSEKELKTIRFCTNYERCVVGCAMLITMKDAAVAGNVTKGINRINNELFEVYNINVEANTFDFDSMDENDFLKISIIAQAVKESTGQLDLKEGIS